MSATSNLNDNTDISQDYLTHVMLPLMQESETLVEKCKRYSPSPETL